MGLSIGQVQALPYRELMRWRVYWDEEPWGAYRDNVHAAMIVIESLRPHLIEGAQISMQDFMYEHPIDRKRRAHARSLATLRSLAEKSKKR